MSTQVKVALITGAFAIGTVVLGALLNPSWWRGEAQSSQFSNSNFVIAGTVTDAASNTPVGQASISIDNPAGSDLSEDNGNFRITLHPPFPPDGIARVHVTKSGYLPYDGTTGPTEALTVFLVKK